MAKRELGDNEVVGVPGPWAPTVPGPWKPPQNVVRGRELTEEEVRLFAQPQIDPDERRSRNAAAESAREVTKGEDQFAATLGGLKKGATSGFSDRIGAALRAPFTKNARGGEGGTVGEEYDANLAQNRRDEDAHAERAPTEWAAGNVMGNFGTGMVAAPVIAARTAAALPEAAAAVRAMSTTRPIITGAGRGLVEGAIQGGIAGAGYSRAPVGSSEFVGDVASGAGVSGLAGGVVGAVGGALTRAANSARGQALQELLTYPTPQHYSRRLIQGKTASAVNASRDAAIKSIEDTPGLKSALLNKDGTAAAIAVEEARGKAIKQLQKTYDYVGKAADGVDLDHVLDRGFQVVMKYDRTSGTEAIAAKLHDDLIAMANKLKRPVAIGPALHPEGRVDPHRLRDEITSLQSRAFAGNAPINPAEGKAAQQELSMALREALNEHIEKVVAGNPAAAKAAGALNGKELRAANRRYGDLDDMSRALGERARAEGAKREGLIATVKGGGRQAADLLGTQGTRAWGHVIERADAGSRPYQVVRALGERVAPVAAATLAGPANVDDPLLRSSGETVPAGSGETHPLTGKPVPPLQPGDAAYIRPGDNAYMSVVRAAHEGGASREEILRRAAAVGLDEGMADWIHRRFGWRDGRPQP